MPPEKRKPAVGGGLRQCFAGQSDVASITERRRVVTGGPRWRRAVGLMVISDYVEDHLRLTPACPHCGGPVLPRTRRPPVCRDCAAWGLAG
jgi:hypothetical protein